MNSPDASHTHALASSSTAQAPSSPLASFKLSAEPTHEKLEALLQVHIDRCKPPNELPNVSHFVHKLEQATALTNSVVRADSGFPSKGEDLKQNVDSLRKRSESACLNFEEQRRRDDKEFRENQAQVLQYYAQLEENRCSSTHSVAKHRTELEQLDLALAEVMAEEDALNLQELRLNHQQALQEEQLRIHHDHEIVPSDCREVLAPTDQDVNATVAWVTNNIQRLSGSHNGVDVCSTVSSSYKPLGQARVAGIQAAEKENQAPLRLGGSETKYWSHAGGPQRLPSTIR